MEIGCNSSGLGRAVAIHQHGHLGSIHLRLFCNISIALSTIPCRLYSNWNQNSYHRTGDTANLIQYFRDTSSLLRISHNSLVSSSRVSQSISRVELGSSLRGTSITRGPLAPPLE
jgi:hypothetical protein